MCARSAFSISTAGTSVGAMLLPMLLHWALAYFDYRYTMLLLGALSANLMVCAALFRPVPNSARSRRLHASSTLSAEQRRRRERSLSGTQTATGAQGASNSEENSDPRTEALGAAAGTLTPNNSRCHSPLNQFHTPSESLSPSGEPPCNSNTNNSSGQKPSQNSFEQKSSENSFGPVAVDLRNEARRISNEIQAPFVTENPLADSCQTDSNEASACVLKPTRVLYVRRPRGDNEEEGADEVAAEARPVVTFLAGDETQLETMNRSHSPASIPIDANDEIVKQENDERSVKCSLTHIFDKALLAQRDFRLFYISCAMANFVNQLVQNILVVTFLRRVEQSLEIDMAYLAITGLVVSDIFARLLSGFLFSVPFVAAHRRLFWSIGVALLASNVGLFPAVSWNFKQFVVCICFFGLTRGLYVSQMPVICGDLVPRARFAAAIGYTVCFLYASSRTTLHPQPICILINFSNWLPSEISF